MKKIRLFIPAAKEMNYAPYIDKDCSSPDLGLVSTQQGSYNSASLPTANIVHFFRADLDLRAEMSFRASWHRY